MASYTSLVGPSGIGKTVAVEEITRQGTYVGLAHPKSRRVYLRLSIIVDRIGGVLFKNSAIFECFAAASLVNVRLCRRFGISPIGFFDI